MRKFLPYGGDFCVVCRRYDQQIKQLAAEADRCRRVMDQITQQRRRARASFERGDLTRREFKKVLDKLQAEWERVCPWYQQLVAKMKSVEHDKARCCPPE